MTRAYTSFWKGKVGYIVWNGRTKWGREVEKWYEIEYGERKVELSAFKGWCENSVYWDLSKTYEDSQMKS